MELNYGSTVSGANVTHEVTNNGLSITLPCVPIDQTRVVAILECVAQTNDRVGVWLELGDDGRYRRLPGVRATIAADEIADSILTPMYIAMDTKPPKTNRSQASQLKIRTINGYIRLYRVIIGNTEHTDFSFILTTGLADNKEVESYLTNDFVLKDGEVAGIWFSSYLRTFFLLACRLKFGLPRLRLVDIRHPNAIDKLRREFDLDAQALLRSDEHTGTFCDKVQLSDSLLVYGNSLGAHIEALASNVIKGGRLTRHYFEEKLNENFIRRPTPVYTSEIVWDHEFRVAA